MSAYQPPAGGDSYRLRKFVAEGIEALNKRARALVDDELEMFEQRDRLVDRLYSIDPADTSEGAQTRRRTLANMLSQVAVQLRNIQDSRELVVQALRVAEREANYR